jgi:hypothetical protein
LSKSRHLWVIETLSNRMKWIPLIEECRFDFDETEQALLDLRGNYVFTTKRAAQRQIKKWKKDPRDWGQYRPMKYVSTE